MILTDKNDYRPTRMAQIQEGGAVGISGSKANQDGHAGREHPHSRHRPVHSDLSQRRYGKGTSREIFSNLEASWKFKITRRKRVAKRDDPQTRGHSCTEQQEYIQTIFEDHLRAPTAGTESNPLYTSGVSAR